MSRKRLKPELSKQIIEDLGGQSEAARKLGTFRSCMNVWAHKTGLPWKYVEKIRANPEWAELRSVQLSYLSDNHINK